VAKKSKDKLSESHSHRLGNLIYTAAFLQHELRRARQSTAICDYITDV